MFASVEMWDTIKTILTLAAHKGWSVFQFDVKSTFLHRELIEDVYLSSHVGITSKEEEAGFTS